MFSGSEATQAAAMLELLYPVVLAALLLLISRIVKGIVAKVKTPAEYSAPRTRSADDDGGQRADSTSIHIGGDSDRGGGGPGHGDGGGGGRDREVVLAPGNLALQRQSSVVDPPIVSGAPGPHSRLVFST